jgi:DHA1 family inner membrane transport protein
MERLTAQPHTRLMLAVLFAGAFTMGCAEMLVVGLRAARAMAVAISGFARTTAGQPVSAFLLAYGMSTALGSYAGGRFADSNASRTLVIGSIGVTASPLAMQLFGGSAWLTALAVVGVGLSGMGMASSMQHRVVSLAGPGGPLASSLPASAVNVGIALGSLAGGVAIDVRGLHAAVLTGAVIGAVAVGAARLTGTLRPAPAASAATERSHLGGRT